MCRLLFILFTLFYTGALWAQSGQTLLNKAKAERDPQAQIKLLNKAIDKSPNLANAYHYRADAYRTLGRYKQALEDYSHTIKLRPNDPFRYYARALLYMDHQHWTPAPTDLNTAIELKPAYKKFYLARARVYQHLGKYENAVADYEKGRAALTKKDSVLDIMPSYIGAYRYEKALRLLNASPQTDTAAAHYWRGRIHWGRNQADEAVSSFSKAINRDNAFAPAYRYRANAYKEMGELEAALADYTVLISLNPEAIFYNRRGLIYEELGLFSQAEEDYSRAIEANPSWAIPYNNRGYVRLRLKDWENAKKDLKTAISLDNTAATPYINLAGAYWLHKKDRKQAYANLDNALKRNFKNVESLYQEDQKGWMFKGLNQTAQFRALLYK